MLARYGDVYGPVVNIASRLTGLARPDTVLVDQELARRWRPSLVDPAAAAGQVRGYPHLHAARLRRAIARLNSASAFCWHR